MVTNEMRINNGGGIRSEVLERLEEDVLVAAARRLGTVKKEKMSKGLVLAFAPIARWAASQRVDRLVRVWPRSSCFAGCTAGCTYFSR